MISAPFLQCSEDCMLCFKSRPVQIELTGRELTGITSFVLVGLGVAVIDPANNRGLLCPLCGWLCAYNLIMKFILDVFGSFY